MSPRPFDLNSSGPDFRAKQKNSEINRPRQFAESEDGSITIFSVYIFLMILMVAGIGVDLMRFERDRAALQYTLDRAVLAAADLDQPLDPKEVVVDYFNKAGLSQYLDPDDVIVTRGINFRNVSATAEASMRTQFMHMTGVDELIVPAVGAAEERVPNVEISLVLDISGSMRFNGRMAALRPAAVNFVNTVLAGDAATKSSINLIPYAGQTNPGPWMFEHLNGQRYPDIELDEEDGGDANNRYPNVSSCLELESSDFDYPGLPNDTSYEQTPHFMNWSIASNVMDWGWCPQDQSSIVYASNNPAKLTGMINNMRMHDGTGTHYAMKYALALLDPSSRSTFSDMATDGEIPNEFAVRPSNWNDNETVKYIVLMTDGQITEQVRPNQYMHEDNPTKELKEGNAAGSQNITSASTNVNSFYKLCNLAKNPNRNVIIYTIAFDVTGAPRTQMKNCASSNEHFFIAGTSNIGAVFASIARQINQLKLVN
jgi:Flp pilus assembly protein TadG